MKNVKQETVLQALLQHSDPDVVKCAMFLAEQHVQRSQTMKKVQEVLQQVKMDVKYIQFDLEATRRERDELLKGKQ